jgi:hypothetical protein
LNGEPLDKYYCRMAEKELDKAIGYYEVVFANAKTPRDKKAIAEKIRKLKEIK